MGVRTPNLPLASSLLELIGNEEISPGGPRRAARYPLPAASSLLELIGTEELSPGGPTRIARFPVGDFWEADAFRFAEWESAPPEGPPTPAAGYLALFARDDHGVYFKDSNGDVGRLVPKDFISDSLAAFALHADAGANPYLEIGTSTEGGYVGSTYGARIRLNDHGAVAGGQNKELALEVVRGRLTLKSSNPTSLNSMSPTLIIADPVAGFGVPVLNGQNQAGAGFVSFAQRGVGSPFFVNMVNLGREDSVWGVADGGAGSEGSCNLNIYGLADPVNGGVQNNINFYQAAGSYAWNGTLRGLPAGARLGQITGFGYCDNLAGSAGLGFVQTETVSIDFYADQPLRSSTSPPLEATTQGGSNIVFKVARTNEGSQTIVGGFFANGVLALGSWSHFGNAFPGSQGNLIMKNTGAPGASVAGGGILFVESGALRYRGSSGTVTTIANA
ncbi:hypothetical protein [Hyphomicrobium sp.]|uniref:hypothetical protein n=1 Tax=Hyphomicrobium sp. TaxID=82 RepID=UPI0013264092|nr:hypothetical protein [Hyphomicrobium sp.]KAB2937400.1 MAG: hypothetical protein F9K20_20120 [Hyphomicrobium sp.]